MHKMKRKNIKHSKSKSASYKNYMVSCLVCCLAAACLPTISLAQAQQSTETNQPEAAANSSSNQMEQSYLEMAQLNQQIEFAKRQLQAKSLQQNLAKLQVTDAQKDLGISVASIEGFDTYLYAVILEKNGGLVHVKPGGIISDTYKVARITPTEVRVIDLATNKIYIVPFVRLKIDTSSKSKAKSESSTDQSTTATEVKSLDAGAAGALASSLSQMAAAGALNNSIVNKSSN